MTDRERIRRWFTALTGLGGAKASRAVNYIRQRESRAWDRGYQDGFTAGFRVANEPCPTCDRAAQIVAEHEEADGVIDLR